MDACKDRRILGVAVADRTASTSQIRKKNKHLTQGVNEAC